jgi:tetratricopeptide (TPR) repeat protein
MPRVRRRLVSLAWALLMVSGAWGRASPSADVRVVRVKAVADEAFRADVGWKEEIRGHLASADERLREVAGIGLDLVSLESWTTHEGSSMPLLLEELRTGVEKDEAEVVIGFTGHPPPAALTFLPGNPRRFPVPFTAGIALPLGDRGVVRRTDWDELTRHTLVHEVAHLFGGLHVREESILETATDRLSFRLDPFNRRVLDFTRDRDFDRGIREIPEDELAALAALYRQAPLRGDSDPDTVIRIAYLFMLAGEVEDALEMVQRALEIAPEQSRGIFRHALIPELEGWAEGRETTVRDRYVLARAYALAERWPAVSDLLGPGCSAPPGDLPSCALLGTAQLELGQHDEAEETLLATLRRNDSLPEVHRALGRVYAATGRDEEAVAAFGRALELAPGDVDLLLELGRASLAAGKAGAAEASFREVLRVRETDEARAKLALAVARQGREDEARALLEPFEARLSLSAFVLRDMAEVYVLSGDAERAFGMVQLAKKGGIEVQAVETLIRQGPEPPPEVELPDLIEQAEAYYRTGRYHTTRELLGRALEKAPWEPRVHYWLGRVAAVADDREVAWEHLRRSVELEPDFLPSRYELARLAYGDEDYADVVVWLEPYVEGQEAGSTAHFMLGRSHFELGRLEEAEEHLATSISKRADYGSAFYFLARVYLEEGRDEDARRELELAVDSPSLPEWRREDAHLRLARLLDAAGEERGAEGHVASALGLGATQVRDTVVDSDSGAADRIELVKVAPSLAKPLPRGHEVLVACTVRFELGTAERGTVFLAPQDQTGHTLLRPQPRVRVERGRGEITLRALMTTPTTGSAVELFLALHAEGHRSTTVVTRARYALE